MGSKVEIIVVNNNKDDNFEYVKRNFPNIKFVVEPIVGLSHARNRGVQESRNDWLFFLDDDAILVVGSLSQVIEMIDTVKYELCTGIWKAWYTSPPPKWLPHSTGNYILKGENTIREIGNDNVSGGVMLINKQKLQEIGGFPTNLGMTGNKVAYGEETYVEEEFKNRGWKVGINPNIVIDHLVGEHKYKLSWHLEAAYAKGRDRIIINQLSKEVSFPYFIKGLVYSITKLPIISLFKFFKSKDYYWQNLVIDVVGNILYFYAMIITILKNKLSNK